MTTVVPRRGLFGALIGQQAVIRAMVLRELQSRFGRNNIGYLWVIAEPMMLASVISILHTVAVGSGGSDGETGSMGVYPFTLLGYCVFIIFRNTFNRSEGMITGAANMLYHAQITPFDIVFSKALVEVLAALSALIVLMGLGIVFGMAHLPVRPVYLFAGIIAMIVLTVGLSMLVSAGTYASHALGRLVHPFSYFMMPLSGAFITMSFLPTWARPYMAWNPYMNIFEMVRYGYFASATDRYFSSGYIVAVSSIMLYMGLLALRRVRRDILVR